MFFCASPLSQMIGEQTRIKRVRKSGMILGVALSLLLISTNHSFGQEITASETLIGVRKPAIQEVSFPLTTTEKVDAAFARITQELERVLFYRIGRQDRQYVIYEPQSVFYRDQGSDGPFRKYEPLDDYPQNELDSQQLQLLSVGGKLLPGSEIDGKLQIYRLGELDGRRVEYVTIKRDDKSDESINYGDKLVYIAEKNEFRKLAPQRERFTDFTVPQATVETWAMNGSLSQRLNGDAGQRDYLLSEKVGGVPVVVAWLFVAGILFTFYMRFFNLRGFSHALDILRGRYDSPDEKGEVTHFQALSSALSGTIGLGNIAGVTIAMTIGGPGAFFWMLVSGFAGMSLKFVECTLAVKYRDVNENGVVLGGPMRYLRIGLAERKMASLGVVLSVSFALMCIIGSFGGGNMLQANQSGSAMLQVFQRGNIERLDEINQEARQAADEGNVTALNDALTRKQSLQLEIAQYETKFKLWFGLILAFCVGIVVMGGIKRIGAAADKLVPGMCLLYSAICMYVILNHIDQLPELINMVFADAFTGKAAGGGIIGAMVIGIQRASFSNEAGVGSAPIAHSAARTGEPIREGCVALLEPFIDTIVICSMTAMVILITGAWNNDSWVVEQGLKGSALTARALQEEVSWFPIALAIAVTLFAYSTILSWSYYGERSWAYLFGTSTTFVYKILMLNCVVIGAVVNLGSVLDFSDIMMLSMAFPNILGLYLLAPIVKRELVDYWARYKAGEFEK